MKFNRKLEYALMALKHMHHKHPGEVTSVKEISDAYGCSPDVTAKVLQKLCRSGVLSSTQGIQGGYMIKKDLNKLNFYDLSNIVLGKQGIVKCIHGSNNCSIKSSCNIIKPISILNSRIEGFYRSLSVTQIIREASHEH
ncbi:MAG: hypothetical protein A4S09_01755 [Proteobacteria bacterium SG_bin7]|nr:MAG: hypothetical protein A4S09_01755 [Proteobacteria bacterium SG_bin7]